ncbi:MAG: histidine kinase [Bacteroidales bacterium]
MRKILYWLLISILVVPALVCRAQSKIDSLQNILIGNIPDTTRLNTLSNLAKEYISLKQVGNAERIVKEAISCAKDKSLSIPYGLYWARAEVHFTKRDIQEGLADIEEVLAILQKTNNVKKIAEAQNFKGLLYLYGGKFSESIEVYNNNIEFAKNNQILDVLPRAYSGLAYVYMNLHDIEEQRTQLVLMADAAIKTENDEMAYNAYLRLGDIGMSDDSNFTYAIEQYKKCLAIEKKSADSAGISFILLRIGWNHYLNKELDTALDYFFYSLEYSIPINRLTSITNAYGNIGTIYRDKKEFDKAILYYQKSIKYSLEANDWYNLSWLYKDMSDMNKSHGDFKKAYENHVLYKQFSDSLDMQKYNRGLAEARTRYESEKAAQELEMVTLKLNQQKYLTYGFAGLIILALTIGLLILRSIRLKNKQRISEMNRKISEVTQRNLRQQMNPHFIFNTLNSIQYYMYQHDKISTNNYLTKFSLLMRKTLENSQHTAIPIKDELDTLELYLQLESLRFKEKFDYKIEVDEEIDTLLHKIPTMLIQPYVENAIGHGLVNKEGNGFVNININLEDNFLVCKVEDNGIGRAASMEMQKEKNKNHNSLGTKITESRLNLVNSLYGKNMKINYTDLKDKEGNPSGTQVIIHIPILS